MENYANHMRCDDLAATFDQRTEVQSTSRAKKAFRRPSVIDLGKLSELTQQFGGSFD